MRPWPRKHPDGTFDRRYRCWPENLHGKWRYHLLFNGHVIATEHSWSALQATAEEHAACLARHPSGKPSTPAAGRKIETVYVYP